MHVRVLGCDGGIGESGRTCALLIDDDVLVDAGTGLCDLPLRSLAGIDHVLLTHAHVDHIAGLPLLIDAAMGRRGAPVTVHAQEETLRALVEHVFNWTLWPDFTKLPSPERPALRLATVRVGETLDIGGRRVTPVPAAHTVPTVGFHLDSGQASLVYCGDTTVCAPLWQAVNAIDNLEHLIIETAFDDSRLDLARRSGHLCPTLLAAELVRLRRPVQVYINHMKPGLGETIMNEIAGRVEHGAVAALARGRILEI